MMLLKCALLVKANLTVNPDEVNHNQELPGLSMVLPSKRQDYPFMVQSWHPFLVQSQRLQAECQYAIQLHLVLAIRIYVCLS
jgi:hypothetical protein